MEGKKLGEDIRILSRPIKSLSIHRELRKLRRRRCSNQQIAWWVKGFYRALQLSGGLLPEIQKILDEEMKKIKDI